MAVVPGCQLPSGAPACSQQRVKGVKHRRGTQQQPTSTGRTAAGAQRLQQRESGFWKGAGVNETARGEVGYNRRPSTWAWVEISLQERRKGLGPGLGSRAGSSIQSWRFAQSPTRQGLAPAGWACDMAPAGTEGPAEPRDGETR